MSKFVEQHKIDIFKETNRILIVGSPGAGKTSFSKQLSSKLALPLYQLDNFYWLQGWKRIDSVLWEKMLTELCTKPQWIIDGNHFATFEKRLKHSNLVILLNYSILLCFWRFLIRSIKRYYGKDNTLPDNIKKDKSYKPRIHIEWHLIKLIVFFKWTVKPKIIKLSSSYNCPIFLLTSPRSAKVFIDRLQDKCFKHIMS